VTDITHRFSPPQIDHHELLAILTLRYTTSWRVSEYEISFPASHDYRLRLEMHHGEITKISSGETLSEATTRRPGGGASIPDNVQREWSQETISGQTVACAWRPIRTPRCCKETPASPGYSMMCPLFSGITSMKGLIDVRGATSKSGFSPYAG
jgi:hypothetical protein